MTPPADSNQPSVRECLRHLLQKTPDNIYFKDTEGRFLLISHAMARYFNLSDPAEAVGKTDFDFFSEEHARKAHNDERMITETGTSLIGREERETWPDGRETWVSTSKEPLCNDQGRIIGTFGISRDITAKKEAEARAMRYAHQVEAANQRMMSDLALAGELQAALLPINYPSFPTNAESENSALRFAHIYEPSEIVGGDFLSILPISETKASVFLCDGIGHGVRAALLAAILSSLFRERARNADSPADCLAQIDRELHALLEPHPDILFATAICMTLDAVSGCIDYANAGHLSPLLLRRSSRAVEALSPGDSAHGPALGLVQGATYQTGQALLDPGDRIILYTDGLIEVLNAHSEQFGEERLAQSLQAASAQSPQDMLTAMLNAAKAFSRDGQFDDDVCAVCVERSATN